MRKQRQEPFTIGPDEIRKRLRISDDEQSVIADLYKLSYGLLMEEEKRGPALDSKAHHLAGVAGICLTLIFSGGAFLLERLQSMPVLPWFKTFGFFYMGASLLSLFALGVALLAARPRGDYKALRQEDLFKRGEMTCKENRYRRYLITHFWKVYQKNFNTNQKKGNLLKVAYTLFFGSLALLLFMTIIAGLCYIK